MVSPRTRPPHPTSSVPIRVYVVEDHPVYQETLVDYLSVTEDLELCGVASSAEQAIEELPGVDPNVVLMDLSLPRQSGFDLLEHIRREWNFPCVILSGHGEQGYVERALAGGARGYVLKGHPQEIPMAVREIMAGGRFVSEALGRQVAYESEEAGA
jgi:DNA-binding NarL/FixJ family response regulator